MYQYETFELTFTGIDPGDNPAQIDLRVTFTHNEKRWTVPGFHDGDGICRVRFLPEKTGDYAWQTEGLIDASGVETCNPAREGNHGPVRAAGTHFTYADGTLFYPFGTTVYALASQPDNLVDETLATLKNAPFNKVRMCVFPKHYEYNQNDPPFYPFEPKEDGGWDVHRPCIAFWRRFESILDRIREMGIQVDLILFHPYDRWGFASLTQEENLVYLDYLVRRFAARPEIWWSLANEYDLCRQKTMEDWYGIEAFVAGHDPFHHLLSNHNCFCVWDAGRSFTTHASIQTKAITEIPYWIRKWGKPVIIDECCYEGDIPQAWGSISGQEMVRRFWRAFALGGYCTHGETFLADDDVLWWAKGGRLKGESPKRIAFLRQIAESLPGPLEPDAGEWRELTMKSDPEIETILNKPETQGFLRSALISILRMPERERLLQLSFECNWASHYGEEAFLWYFDLQCYGKQTLRLPDRHSYRIEVIDTWEMKTWEANPNASGDTEIQLPGKEGIAVLARRL